MMAAALVALVGLSLCPLLAAGPPYLYLDGRRANFKPAMFGGEMHISACHGVWAMPKLANRELQNAAMLRGKIAVIERDGPKVSDADRLSFIAKSRRAQAAGAAMAIMVNYNDDQMRPADTNGSGGDITIPVIGVTKSEGAALMRAKRIDLVYDVDDRPSGAPIGTCQVRLYRNGQPTPPRPNPRAIGTYGRCSAPLRTPPAVLIPALGVSAGISTQMFARCC